MNTLYRCTSEVLHYQRARFASCVNDGQDALHLPLHPAQKGRLKSATTLSGMRSISLTTVCSFALVKWEFDWHNAPKQIACGVMDPSQVTALAPFFAS